jgi:hypothetical protein
MESLNNYITERIRVDNLKHQAFPNTSSIEEMVEFLREQNFVDVTNKNLIYWEQVFNILNLSKSKCYIYDQYTHPANGVKISLKFADTTNGNISRKNPLFLCNEINNGDNIYKLCYEPAKDDTVNHDKFVDAANKYLNL